LRLRYLLVGALVVLAAAAVAVSVLVFSVVPVSAQAIEEIGDIHPVAESGDEVP
jgi:hypothetical protein